MADRISVTSLYGTKSRIGMVQIDMGAETAQLSVGDAINHARRILEAANAAASDATLAWFLMDKLGIGQDMIVQVMLDFRRWRDEHEPG